MWEDLKNLVGSSNTWFGFMIGMFLLGQLAQFLQGVVTLEQFGDGVASLAVVGLVTIVLYWCLSPLIGAFFLQKEDA